MRINTRGMAAIVAVTLLTGFGPRSKPLEGVYDTDGNLGSAATQSLYAPYGERTIGDDLPQRPCDFNGDGDDDVITTYEEFQSDGWGLGVSYGGLRSGPVNGIDAMNLWFTADEGYLYGASNVDCGDINQDGKDDILVGFGAANNGTGAVYVIYGSSTLSDGTRVLENYAQAVIRGDMPGDRAGWAVFIGDMAGSAGACFAVGANGQRDEGIVSVFCGRPWGEYTISDGDAVLRGNASDDYSARPSAIGDVNGDGKDDMAISSWANELYVFVRALDGTDDMMSSADLTIRNKNASEEIVWAAGGDVNGDGRGDILVTMPYVVNDADAYIGSVGIFLGPLNFDRSVRSARSMDVRIDGATSITTSYGSRIDAADLDDDGFTDWISCDYANHECYLFYGQRLLPRSMSVNDAKAMFISSQSSALMGYNAHFADLTGDGDLDVVIDRHTSASANISGSIDVWATP